MTNYAALIQAVYVETGRPDLVNETAAAVVQAVVGLHGRGRYRKDIKRARVTFDYASHIQELEIDALPFYRNIAWAKMGTVQSLLSNGTYQAPTTPIISQVNNPYFWLNMPEFEVIEADDILNVNGYLRRNVVYQAGMSLYFRCMFEFQFAQFGWFSFPNVDTTNNAANFDSWIANEYQYAVVLAAAANVYQKKGQYDLANTINNGNPNNPASIQYWFDIIDRNNIAA